VAATFLVVPEWQGSGSSRAMRLIDGASAIQGDLPSSVTRVVDVPVGAGEAQETGVLRFTAIHSVRESQRRMLDAASGTVITVGGDCGVELASVPHAVGPDTAVVWFDAHGDLNTPDSSPSHAFGGMVLRTLLGDGPDALVPDQPLSPSRVVLAGTRSLDDAEADYLAVSGIRMLSPAELERPDSLVEAVAATGATSVYVHIDLDVLDPAVIDGVGYPEPFGVSVVTLVAAVQALRGAYPLVGAGVTGFAPVSPDAAVDDLPTILRVMSSLTR
jgi:arginase